MKNSKKGQVENLAGLVTTLGFMAVLLAVTFLILAEVKSEAESVTGSNTSFAVNATGEVQNAMQDIPGWLPIIVVTVIGALLLGLIQVFRRGN